MAFPFSTLEILTTMIPKEVGLSKSDLVYSTDSYRKRRGGGKTDLLIRKITKSMKKGWLMSLQAYTHGRRTEDQY
jgi:hypothetical protein